jgi:hypothetical protein
MSFKDSPIYSSLNKIRDAMFNDLDKTLDLHYTSRGAPNFLLGLVLCCYTEYWGKLMYGKPPKEKRGYNKTVLTCSLGS